MGHQVITAGPADAGALARVIAEAFFDLPPARWLIDDPLERARVFPPYFKIFVDHALRAGLVHTTPGRTAVALWLPVGADGPGPPGEDYPARLATVTGQWAPRFGVFDARLGEHHPTGAPHHHLAMLAVRPPAQGQGIGTALLAAHHAALDRAGLPAYLEASAERNRAWYTRHGYAEPGLPFRIASGGPPMWPMWRPPAGG